MYINSPDLNQIDDDDLFTRPPRSARRMPVVRQARRQCRACDLTYVVSLDYDGPPLCEGCRADLDATRARIERDLASIISQQDVAGATWLAFAAEHADDWDRIQAARKLPDYAERCAKHRQAGNIYGKLLDAHAEYEQALAALGAERARLERALEACEV